jgi:hypothetical protein
MRAKNQKNKSSKRYYLLLSGFFIFLLVAGVALNSGSLLAQINNFYNKSTSQDGDITSLMSAVINNDVDGVRFFSKSGQSLVNQKNIGGATALHLAARQQNLEMVTILIENGADVNAADNEGWTALMRASLAGKGDIVDLLLDKGAKADMLNLVQESAIIHATSADCLSCLNSMFQKFNFIKNTDAELLKGQVLEAFVIAQNHENKATQDALDQYLNLARQMGLLTPNVTSTMDNEPVILGKPGKKTYKLKPSGLSVNKPKELKPASRADRANDKIIIYKKGEDKSAIAADTVDTMAATGVEAKKFKLLKGQEDSAAMAAPDSLPVVSAKDFERKVFKFVKTKEDLKPVDAATPFEKPVKIKMKKKALIKSPTPAAIQTQAEIKPDANGEEF